MGKQYVLHFDDPKDIPFAWQDLVRLHGLEKRADLNNLLGQAHGRVKKGTRREGVTILSTGEEVWVLRSKAEQIRTLAQLDEVRVAHALDNDEYERGVEQIGGSLVWMENVQQKWRQMNGGESS